VNSLCFDVFVFVFVFVCVRACVSVCVCVVVCVLWYMCVWGGSNTWLVFYRGSEEVEEVGVPLV